MAKICFLAFAALTLRQKKSFNDTCLSGNSGLAGLSSGDYCRTSVRSANTFSDGFFCFYQAGYGGINPYALGFSMMQDLRRICEKPDAEDRRWFSDIAGADWLKVLDFAMRNFKDESFIAQYLSPKLIRAFHFFAVADHQRQPALEIDSIHDDAGYTRVCQLLSGQHKRDNQVPDVHVARYEKGGDRSLVLVHQMQRGRPLAAGEASEVLRHLERLWGFRVSLETVTEDGRVDELLANAA